MVVAVAGLAGQVVTRFVTPLSAIAGRSEATRGAEGRGPRGARGRREDAVLDLGGPRERQSAGIREGRARDGELGRRGEGDRADGRGRRAPAVAEEDVRDAPEAGTTPEAPVVKPETPSVRLAPSVPLPVSGAVAVTVVAVSARAVRSAVSPVIADSARAGMSAAASSRKEGAPPAPAGAAQTVVSRLRDQAEGEACRRK